MRDGDRVIRERLLRDAVLAGDVAAWRAWYEEAYAPLESYVIWRSGNLRQFAEDVLQETWLTAVRLLRRFDPNVGSFISWLRGMTANIVRNHLRKWKRTKRMSQALPEDVPDRTVDDVEERERSERIAFALAALPDRYEAALRAKYLDQMSVAEIALEWHESPKAVESLLTRARAAFREAYELREPDHATG